MVSNWGLYQSKWKQKYDKLAASRCVQIVVRHESSIQNRCNSNQSLCMLANWASLCFMPVGTRLQNKPAFIDTQHWENKYIQCKYSSVACISTGN